jgi:serine phosphatase RsbU (regulator of sigma subunit)
MKIGIKVKLFASFIILCIFSLFFTIVIIWLNNKRSKISDQLHSLDEVHLLSMEEYKIQQEFLIYKSVNPSFYRTGKSLILMQQNSINASINSRLNYMAINEESKQLFQANFINNMLKDQSEYQRIFLNVVNEVKKKGFKDFGIEGAMRNYAHELMKIKEIDQINILMLRRHEKDFIIRKEVIYISQFKNVVRKVKSEILNNKSLSLAKKNKLNTIVENYNLAFSNFVNSEWVLNGKIPGQGLIGQLSKQHDRIISKINSQKKIASFAEVEIQKKLLNFATVMILIIVSLSFFFSYKLAYELSKPISNLNLYIKRYVASKFSIIPVMEERKSKDEIAELSDNFFRMAEEITSYIKFFEDKVKERTAEINKQHNEISRQKSKIDIQYKQLMIKSGAMEMQQKLLIEKNTSIMDSLRYAERIQKAIMPSMKMVKSILPESFIYFAPLEIVSGDFYFIYKKENKVFFAVADCTGHGVPGAFVSIIGIHAIHRALNEFKFVNPSAILNKVNELVEQDLSNYGNTIINDGMDIAFCCLDTDTQTLEYSGANIPIWIVSASAEEDLESVMHQEEMVIENTLSTGLVLKEVKADNQPIGHIQKRVPFTNHIIDIQKGDMIYIFSDGYADQFGGDLGKKFKYKKLKSMLLDIHRFPAENQKQLVKEAIKAWQGNNEQVDDICVLGVRV